MNHECVTRLGAFDEEGACFRIARLASLHTRGVKAARVDGGRDHVIARLNTKHGCMSAGEGVVEFCGLKPMGFGETGNGQRKHKEQFHIYSPVWTSISSGWRAWRRYFEVDEAIVDGWSAIVIYFLADRRPE
jgi:hypothetical protein